MTSHLKPALHCLLMGNVLILVLAVCPKPDVPQTVFALSSALSSYNQDYVYEVVCVPGFSPSSVAQLVCEQSGAWRGSLPHCKKDEIQGRWWLPLVLVTAVIVAVPCLIPRIYYSHYEDGTSESAAKKSKSQRDTGIKPDEIELSTCRSKPSPLAGKMMQTSADDVDAATAQVTGGQQERTTVIVEMYPVPLPPIRNRQMVLLPSSEHDKEMVKSPQRPGSYGLSPIQYSQLDSLWIGRNRDLESTC